MKKTIFTLALILVFSLISCSDSSSPSSDTQPDPSSNLKTKIVGYWLVTRTLVSGSTSFPEGYQDQQNWNFTKNGENMTLTAPAGSINGQWKSSQTWADAHWVFETTFTDPATSMNYKVLVEIIGVDPLKGTNETYMQDVYTGGWTLLDAFSINGSRI